MATIVLDTNFLMIPSSLGVDILSEIDRICDFRYDLAVVRQTIDELKKISELQSGKHKAAARLALQIIKNNNINIIETTCTTNADDAIISLLEQKRVGAGFIVATQDKELKKRIKKKGCPLIVLRQKKYLWLEKV